MLKSNSLPKNQSLRTSLLFMALLLVLIMLILGFMLWSARQATIHRAEVSASNFANVLQVRIDATFQRIDAILRTSSKTFPPEILRTDSQSLADRSNQALFTNYLEEQILDFDAVAGIRVNDAQGRLRYASGGLPSKAINSGDRDFFIAQRDNPKQGLFFSKALTSRITNKDVMVVSRGLRDAQGNFYGVISVGVELHKLQQQFQQLHMNKDDSIFLRRLDNHHLITRWPHVANQVNVPLVANHPVVTKLNGGAREFRFRNKAQVDQIDRYLAISVFEHYPFYVGVAQSVEGTLVEWRKQAWMVGLSATGILLLLYGLVIKLLHAQRREVVALSSLAHNQARMRLLAQVFEYSGEATILLDKDTNIIEVNATFCRLTGYTLDEVRGKTWRTLFTEVTQANALHTFDASWQEEMFCTRKDGRQFICLFAQTPMVDVDATTQYQIINFSDISERKRAEKLKDEFVSTVSHELRTPLTSINGALGLVLGGAVGEIPQKLKALLDIAKRNAEHLGHTINDLLDMEKLEAGKMLLNCEILDVMPQIEAALEKNQSYAEQHKVNCKIIQRVDAAQVFADPHRLQQVLLNILSNAAKFSPAGSQIDVNAYANGDKLRIAVTDHGQGVPLAFQASIFQKFAQADSADTRKQGGTGLGLSISKQLIEQMSGTIGFTSQDGVGSTFFIELPQHHPTN